jgi:hypothetical protein
MTMKGMYRVALMMGLVASSAASVEAAVIDGTPDATHEIRVVNNYVSPVRVYVQDAQGRLHQLGRVGRGRFKVLKVSNEIAELGDFRLKIYPSEPIGSLVGDDDGIKTRELALEAGEAINLWLETDLTQSMVQVEKG